MRPRETAHGRRRSAPASPPAQSSHTGSASVQGFPWNRGDLGGIPGPPWDDRARGHRLAAGARLAPAPVPDRGRRGFVVRRGRRGRSCSRRAIPADGSNDARGGGDARRVRATRVAGRRQRTRSGSRSPTRGRPCATGRSSASISRPVQAAPSSWAGRSRQLMHAGTRLLRLGRARRRRRARPEPGRRARLEQRPRRGAGSSPACRPARRRRQDLWALQVRPGALLRLDPRTLAPTEPPLRLRRADALGLGRRRRLRLGHRPGRGRRAADRPGERARQARSRRRVSGRDRRRRAGRSGSPTASAARSPASTRDASSRSVSPSHVGTEPTLDRGGRSASSSSVTPAAGR